MNNFICGFYAVNGHHCLNDETNRCYVCGKQDLVKRFVYTDKGTHPIDVIIMDELNKKVGR